MPSRGLFSSEARLLHVPAPRGALKKPSDRGAAFYRGYDLDGRRVRRDLDETAALLPSTPEVQRSSSLLESASGERSGGAVQSSPTTTAFRAAATAGDLLRESLSADVPERAVRDVLTKMETFLGPSDIDEALLISQLPAAERMRLQDEAANRMVAMVIDTDASARRRWMAASRPPSEAAAAVDLAASLTHATQHRLARLVDQEIAALEAVSAATAARARGEAAPPLPQASPAPLRPVTATPPGLTLRPRDAAERAPRALFGMLPASSRGATRIAAFNAAVEADAFTAAAVGGGGGRAASIGERKSRGGGWVHAALRQFFALFIQRDVCGATPSATAEDERAQLYCVRADRVAPVAWAQVRNSVESLGSNVASSSWGWQVRAPRCACASCAQLFEQFRPDPERLPVSLSSLCRPSLAPSPHAS